MRPGRMLNDEERRQVLRSGVSAGHKPFLQVIRRMAIVGWADSHPVSPTRQIRPLTCENTGKGPPSFRARAGYVQETWPLSSRGTRGKGRDKLKGCGGPAAATVYLTAKDYGLDAIRVTERTLAASE